MCSKHLHATLFEVETHWSINDLADAHEALDELEEQNRNVKNDFLEDD